MPINTSVNQDQIYGFLYSEFFTLWYKATDGEWINIPGIESTSQSGGEAPMRDVVSVNGAATQNMGITRTGSMSFSAKIMPNDVAWRFLRDAQYKRTLVHFRMDTDATLLHRSLTTGGATVDIATTGVLEFDDGADETQPTITGTGFGRGAFVVSPRTGSKRYFAVTNINGAEAASNPNQIEVLEINASNEYVAPTSAIDAGSFDLYGQIPMRQEFSALVPSASNIELSSESEMMTTLTLALRSRLSTPTIIRV